MSASHVDELVGKPSRWLAEPGAESDLVLSTRVRLARNLKNIPFTQRAADEEMGVVVSRVVTACQSSAELGGGVFLPMAELGELDRQFLAERHLISREMVTESRPAGLYLTKGEHGTVMVNEEDHLRITSVVPGLELDAAWNEVRAIEEQLDAALEFAYSDDLGYLTACPTNVGTGMRALGPPPPAVPRPDQEDPPGAPRHQPGGARGARVLRRGIGDPRQLLPGLEPADARRLRARDHRQPGEGHAPGDGGGDPGPSHPAQGSAAPDRGQDLSCPRHPAERPGARPRPR